MSNTIHLLLCVSNATDSSMSSLNLWIPLHPLKSLSAALGFIVYPQGVYYYPTSKMQLARDASLSNLASFFLASPSPSTISSNCMQPCALCPYSRQWCLPFRNDHFRQLTLSPWLCNLPAFLCISTNKLFFKTSKEQANIPSLSLPIPYRFHYLSRWVQHPQHAVDNILSFLLLLPFCLPTWQNPENPVSAKLCRLLPTLNNSHQSQLGTQHS